MHRFSLAVLAVVFASVSANWIQATQLAGRVLDPRGGVLPGVELTLMEEGTPRRWAQLSGPQGEFRFADLRPGRYLLRAGMAGFRTEVIPLVLREAPRDLDLTLQVGGLSDRVVVTAAARPQLLSELSRASTIVDADEMERRKQMSLGEALLGLPGLRVQRLGAPGSFTTVRFRGLREVDTGLLLDGHPVRDAAGFRGDITSFLQDIMLPNLERIELLPGASSHLYGSSSSGGVINLIPQPGRERATVEAGFEGGSLSLFRETVHARGSAGERFLYSLGAQRTDVNRGLGGDGVFRNTSLNGFLRYDVKPDISLSGIVLFSDTPRLDLNHSPFPIGPQGNELGYETGEGPIVGFMHDLDDPDARRESRLFSGILTWRHRVHPAWSYSLFLQETRSHRNFPDGPEIHPFLGQLGVFGFSADLNRIDGEHRTVGLRNYLELGTRNQLLLGIEHSREARTQEFVSQAFRSGPTTDRQTSTAFFAQDQAALLDRKLHLTASFRAELFEVRNPESAPELRGLKTPDAYTGGLSLSYLFRNTGTKIRTQAANGFRAPSLSERFATFTSSVGPVRIGNPLLRPERALTLDGGVDQLLFDRRIRLSATYFYNRLQEIITSRRQLFQQANERGGLSRGVELDVLGALPFSLDLNAGYTYVRAEFISTADLERADRTVLPAGVARPFEGTPRHEWRAGLNWRRGSWNVNTTYLGMGAYQETLFSPRFFQQYLFDLDGYQRLDAVVSYTLPVTDEAHLEFYLKGYNLTHREYFEDGFQTPGASAWGGVRYRFR